MSVLKEVARIAKANPAIRKALVVALRREAATYFDKDYYLAKPGAEVKEYPNLKATVVNYVTTLNKPAAAMFVGRGQRALWAYSFNNTSQRESYVKGQLEKVEAAVDAANARRKEKAEFQHGLKVGDILYSSWGYDQTNIDFYQVVAVKDKTVDIREIDKKVVRRERGADYVMPEPGHFVGAVLKNKRPSKGYGGGASIRLTSYSGASTWDGKPKYQTPSEMGH
jgi:hypothetical protein